jgi:hypothetical protein
LLEAVTPNELCLARFVPHATHPFANIEPGLASPAHPSSRFALATLVNESYIVAK